MTNPLDEIRQRIKEQKSKDRAKQEARSVSKTKRPVPTSAIKVQGTRIPEIREACRTEISETRLAIEPMPLSAYDDNPVLSERGAAVIVGVSSDLLKK